MLPLKRAQALNQKKAIEKKLEDNNGDTVSNDTEPRQATKLFSSLKLDFFKPNSEKLASSTTTNTQYNNLTDFL